MQNHPNTLSNSQLEILKSFRYHLSEADLKKLRQNLAHFIAEILTVEADKIYDKENWDENYINTLLNTKMRKRN